MDKKKRIKTIAAVCFVVVCGGIYLAVRAGTQGDSLSLEKRTEVWRPQGGTAHEEAFATVVSGAESGGETVDTVTSEPEVTPEAVGTVFVHVCGAVLREGVYELPEGSRVTDGITAAGGFAEAADTAYHNLASLLRDGQRIYVPTKEETDGWSVEERMSETDRAETTGQGGTETRDARVNLNTAGQAELMTLSGIGESKAASILQYREKVGLFQSIEELKNVSGIGEAMFERIKDSVRIE